jgi:hypothetical protein
VTAGTPRFWLRPARLVAAALLAMAGCAADGGARRDDDGTVTVGCSGGYHDWGACYSRAEAACGKRGYEILSRVTNEGSEGVGTRDWTAAGSEVSRTMVVRCRP